MPGYLRGGVGFGFGAVQESLLGLGFEQVRGEQGQAGVVGVAVVVLRFGAGADSGFAQLHCRVCLYFVGWGLLVFSGLFRWRRALDAWQEACVVLWVLLCGLEVMLLLLLMRMRMRKRMMIQMVVGLRGSLLFFHWQCRLRHGGHRSEKRIVCT